MNTKSLLIAAIGTVFSGAVLATGTSPVQLQQEAQLLAPSIGTRAAVLVEVLKARATGTLEVNPDYDPHPGSVSGASALARAEVRAQRVRARANGTLDMDVEYGGQ